MNLIKVGHKGIILTNLLHLISADSGWMERNRHNRISLSSNIKDETPTICLLIINWFTTTEPHAKTDNNFQNNLIYPRN